ncbi:MAG TPA: hypothetical protein VN408_06010 [Actinoplanes sp.]|nr:hypothetical protein [Actinoplanes sp.]
MSVQDLRPLFTEADAAETQAALALQPVEVDPGLGLDEDTAGLLRDGLGRYDMDIRWMAHLDDAGVLRLWRSWTGIQVYEARVTGGVISELRVEEHPERYRGPIEEEPETFERVLIACVRHLRYFRAGHTPYGPSASAGPEPAPWP